MQISLFDTDLPLENTVPGFRWRRSRVWGEHLGASVYELPPGEKTWKYHYELGVDELLVVVRGRPHLRTHDRERQLAEGDCVLLPAGPEGGHQVSNRTDESVRVLIVGNWTMPRAVFYPDSGEIKMRWAVDESGQAMWRLGDEVDYWESEREHE